jgi:hypothetical protein
MKTAMLLTLLIAICAPAIEPAATSAASASTATDDTAQLAATLDQRLTDAYHIRDWSKLQSLLAPDYSAISEAAEWDLATLQREFPKIHLIDFKIEQRHIRRLSPDLLLINEVAFMHETYENDDTSGRYSNSDIWVRRNGRWLLLLEQEVRLRDSPK